MRQGAPFDPETVLQAVDQERCTALLGVPTMFIAELEHPSFERYETSSLSTGIMAGSPCPMEVMKKVVDVMGADEIIDDEGWLHTGDLAVMDENGYVRIIGRAKDMIIRGGENVYPREVEEFLYTHPDISDAQVYGVPDEKYSERVAAAVKARPGSNLSAEDFKDYCHESIAYYKVPEYVDFVEESPMTASGKIQKYKLREAAVERYGLQKVAGVEPA